MLGAWGQQVSVWQISIERLKTTFITARILGNKANKESWTGNKKLQVCYYNYLYEKKFIFGDIKNDDKKAKTARQKRLDWLILA